MTFWRGMFRVWILATALWAIFVAAVSWSGISDPLIPRQSYYIKDAQSDPYQLADAYPPYAWTQAQREISLPNRVTLYVSRDVPEVGVVIARELLKRRASDTRNGEAWTARMEAIGVMVAIIGSVSGVVLALGFAVRWVLQGFGFQRRKPSP